MVLRSPPLAEPKKYPGGVKVRPPFEMRVANLNYLFYIENISNSKKEHSSKSY